MSVSSRSRARELIVQALYQRLLAGHDLDELQAQCHARAAYRRADGAYFDRTLAAIVDDQDELERLIDGLADRPLAQLDPVERAILLLGVHELRNGDDVPYKVAINESVNLAKKFGAVDSHKYINALLDRAAKELQRKSA